MPDTLKSGLSVDFPVTITRLPTGEVLFANGLNKPQRWDGITSASENAGIPRSGTCTATSGGSGSIDGVYTYAVRFLDDENIPGDMSTTAVTTVDTVLRVTYSGIPTSSDSRVTQRQVFRSSAGQSTVLYLDTTIADNTTVTIASTFTDSTLQNRTAIAVLKPDGTPNSRRFGVPPSNKLVVVSHQDRTFWAVDPVLDQGHAEMTTNSVTAVLHGATVTDQLVSRELHVRGHNTVYTISAVSPTANNLTLSVVFSGPTNLFSKYAVKSPKTERNLIYFSEAGEPESVPSTNAIRLRQEDGEGNEITAVASIGSFMWLFTLTRTYRWTFMAHPVLDGAIFPATYRGCINQRTWAQVEGISYILDREGVYSFSGGAVSPISQGIQDIFRPNGGIHWENEQWFHADYYDSEETVKFFVCLDGSKYPRHAICFHYRQNTWWIEEYPWPVPSSAVVPVAKHRRMLIGTTHDRVMLTSEGTLDGPSKPLKARGTVASATHTSVTVASPNFTVSDVVNSPIQIVKGKGKGQRRVIFEANGTTGRIDIDRGWNIKPDSTSEFQIGGVDWNMKTRWLRLSDMEEDNTRAYRLAFQPTETSASLDIRSYFNYETVPINNQGSYDLDKGTNIDAGKPDVEKDMKAINEGWTRHQFGGHQDHRGPASRFVACELRGVQNQDHVKIRSLGVDGVQ